MLRSWFPSVAANRSASEEDVFLTTCEQAAVLEVAGSSADTHYNRIARYPHAIGMHQWSLRLPTSGLLTRIRGFRSVTSELYPAARQNEVRNHTSYHEALATPLTVTKAPSVRIEPGVKLWMYS